MEQLFIYTLSCPITNHVHYVGASRQGQKRLRGHLSKTGNTCKDAWIEDLLSKKVLPKLEIVDTVNIEDWNLMESFYISLFRSWGFNLFNIAEGGKSGFISAAVNRAKSESMKGRKLSEVTKQRIRDRAIGRKASEESKRKMSEARSGKQPEWLKSFSTSISNPRARAVNQLSLDGSLIKRWDYGLQAVTELGLNRTAVTDCCKGRQKTAGGFQWEYA